jgi:hypothetical protein
MTPFIYSGFWPEWVGCDAQLIRAAILIRYDFQINSNVSRFQPFHLLKGKSCWLAVKPATINDRQVLPLTTWPMTNALTHQFPIGFHLMIAVTHESAGQTVQTAVSTQLCPEFGSHCTHVRVNSDAQQHAAALKREMSRVKRGH